MEATDTGKGEQAITTLASEPLEVCDSRYIPLGFLKWGQAS